MKKNGKNDQVEILEVAEMSSALTITEAP